MTSDVARLSSGIESGTSQFLITLSIFDSKTSGNLSSGNFDACIGGRTVKRVMRSHRLHHRPCSFAVVGMIMLSERSKVIKKASQWSQIPRPVPQCQRFGTRKSLGSDFSCRDEGLWTDPPSRQRDSSKPSTSFNLAQSNGSSLGRRLLRMRSR